MLLGKVIQRVGARRRITIDYSDWLTQGEWLTGVACTVDQGEATVDTIALAPDAKSVSFFLDGGTLADIFNIIVEATTNYTARRYDTVQVFVETNGGVTILAGQTALMLSIIGPTGPTGPTGP
jgi:hypothetical protein